MANLLDQYRAFVRRKVSRQDDAIERCTLTVTYR